MPLGAITTKNVCIERLSLCGLSLATLSQSARLSPLEWKYIVPKSSSIKGQWLSFQHHFLGKLDLLTVLCPRYMSLTRIKDHPTGDGREHTSYFKGYKAQGGEEGGGRGQGRGCRASAPNPPQPPLPPLLFLLHPLHRSAVLSCPPLPVRGVAVTSLPS